MQITPHTIILQSDSWAHKMILYVLMSSRHVDVNLVLHYEYLGIVTRNCMSTLCSRQCHKWLYCEIRGSTAGGFFSEKDGIVFFCNHVLFWRIRKSPWTLRLRWRIDCFRRKHVHCDEFIMVPDLSCNTVDSLVPYVRYLGRLARWPFLARPCGP